MPDLTIQAARWCSSNENWSRIVRGSGGKQYVVRFDSYSHTNPQVQRDFSCSCPRYKYNQKGHYCKHILAVKHECCRYGWEAAAGSPVEMGDTCPECGAKTTAMSYAT